MNLSEALKILGLGTPTTTNAVKQAYKRKSLLEHPDQSKHPKAHERFQRVRKAYEVVRSSDAIEFSLEDMRSIVCVDGTPLSNLGLGLGPTANGLPCDVCDSKGFQVFTVKVKTCDNCRPAELFTWDYKCSRCSGTGVFKTKKGVTKGACFKCKGRGWVKGKTFRNTCFKCHGARVINDPKAPPMYRKCDKCKGLGEEEMFNPVLPKGLLNL